MTVKAVAVRYWFSLTGEIEAMRRGTRDRFDAFQFDLALYDARLTLAQRSIITILILQPEPAD